MNSCKGNSVKLLSARILRDEAHDDPERPRLSTPVVITRQECRATRMVDDSTRFLLVKFPNNIKPHSLRIMLAHLMENGIEDPSSRNVCVALFVCTCASPFSLNTAHRYHNFGCTENGIKRSTWTFFREDSRCTVESLLDDLGDLDSVFWKDGPAKYAARLGLSFTPSVKSIDASACVYFFFAPSNHPNRFLTTGQLKSRMNAPTTAL